MAIDTRDLVAPTEDDLNQIGELLDLAGDAIARRCRVCGCTDDNACYPTCSWSEPDLCSLCVDVV